jgi:hypothetical protein
MIVFEPTLAQCPAPVKHFVQRGTPEHQGRGGDTEFGVEGDPG